MVFIVVSGTGTKDASIDKLAETYYNSGTLILANYDKCFHIVEIQSRSKAIRVLQ